MGEVSALKTNGQSTDDLRAVPLLCDTVTVEMSHHTSVQALRMDPDVDQGLGVPLTCRRGSYRLLGEFDNGGTAEWVGICGNSLYFRFNCAVKLKL